MSPTAALRTLLKLKKTFGPGAAAEKFGLLSALERAKLPSQKAVRDFHEALLFLRAYPDDAAVFGKAGDLLERFDARADLRRLRRALTNSGIAGTRVEFAFYWFTAFWLARHCPENLRVDWAYFDRKDDLAAVLPLLLPYGETLALDSADLGPREWVERLKASHETDAAFLIKRFAKFPGGDFAREKAYEDLDIPLILEPGLPAAGVSAAGVPLRKKRESGPGVPSRTRARFSGAPAAYRSVPLKTGRPDLNRAVRREPRSIRSAGPAEARELVALARGCMATRARDLDAFAHADIRDVRLADFPDGLQFALIGMLPERRLVLEAAYGYLILKNGVPIGYGVLASLWGSTEVAFNTFSAFRGTETAFVFASLLALARRVFGSDAFTLDSYQIGEDNPEALKSGAWWFYQKLGFRPASRENRSLMRRELARMKARRSYRCGLATLKRLSSENLYYFLGRERDDVLGKLPLDRIGLAALKVVSGKFGSDRERARRECARAARSLLGVRSIRGWSRDEREAWERWAPIVLALPGVKTWSPGNRSALAGVVRAKGGRRESDYAILLNAHAPLRRAIRYTI